MLTAVCKTTQTGIDKHEQNHGCVCLWYYWMSIAVCSRRNILQPSGDKQELPLAPWDVPAITQTDFDTVPSSLFTWLWIDGLQHASVLWVMQCINTHISWKGKLTTQIGKLTNIHKGDQNTSMKKCVNQ